MEDDVVMLYVCSKNVLTMQEAARYLGVSVDALRELVCDREVACCKPRPELRYFRREDLEEFMQRNRFLPTEPKH